MNGFISIFLIVYIYLYFLKINKRFIGVLTGLLIAIAPVQVYFSQELRPYILLTTLITIQFLYFWKILDEGYKRKTYIWFFVLGILSIFTHLISIFIFSSYLFVSILLFVIYKKKHIVNKFALFAILNLVLIVLCIPLMYTTTLNPMYIISEGSFNQYVGGFEGLNLAFFTTMIYRFKEVFTMFLWYGNTYTIVSSNVQFWFKKLIFVLVMISLFYPLFHLVRSKKIKTDAILVFVFGFTLLQVYIAEKAGLFPFGGRYIMPFSVIMYLIIANFLDNFKRNKFVMAIIIISLIAMSALFYFHENCLYILTNKGYDLNKIQMEAYSICQM